LNRVGELAYIRQTGEGEWSLGAMTRQRAVEAAQGLRQALPLLHDAVAHIAHPQIRTRGTLGGSLVHADPAAELPVAAIALDARIRVVGQEGQRWIPAAEFFQGMFFTDLAADEILVEVVLPPQPDRTGWAFLEFARRQGDYALIGVAALVTLDAEGVCNRARLVYLNAGDGPVDAVQAAGSLVGHAPLEDRILTAAEAMQSEIDPFGNVHATPEYQRHLARVLTVRALRAAVARARNGTAEA
jgi:carbon-monoxide dehydrogenase medium subunit